MKQQLFILALLVGGLCMAIYSLRQTIQLGHRVDDRSRAMVADCRKNPKYYDGCDELARKLKVEK